MLGGGEEGDEGRCKEGNQAAPIGSRSRSCRARTQDPAIHHANTTRQPVAVSTPQAALARAEQSDDMNAVAVALTRKIEAAETAEISKMRGLLKS